jgi:hypothetical protein
LVTSRRRLDIQGERVCPVPGLVFEAARRLFVERAREAYPQFAAGGEEARIDAICTAVGGLPLGLELAASWAGECSPAEILRSISSLSVHPGAGTGQEQRHRDLTGVLTFSWSLLEPVHQTLLASLTVFSGSFHRSAAAEVVGASAEALSRLCAHSLLERDAPGRYSFNPLVREFCVNRRDAPVPEDARRRHRRHFLRALADGDSDPEDLAKYRLAWTRATLAGDANLVGAAAGPFSSLLAGTGLLEDGHDLFAAADSAFEADERRAELVARLLRHQWTFARATRGLPHSEGLQRRLLALSRDPALVVETRLQLANRFAEEGRWAEAEDQFDRAEEMGKRCSGPIPLFSELGLTGSIWGSFAG